MTLPIHQVFQQTSSVTAAPENASSGARLVSPSGVSLPLESATLRAEAGGGIARSVLRQRFRNTSGSPLEVTYLLPLPSDAAVCGYSFELSGKHTRGVVEPKHQARERYEEALMSGHSAALLEQERSALFRQAIGNIPPGQSIDIEVSLDHPLAWVSNGWEYRFPTVVAPRYLNEESHDASCVSVVAHDDGSEARAPRAELQLEIGDRVTAPPRSPSHGIASQQELESTCVHFEGARLDRDVVVRWGVALEHASARLETARPTETHRYATSQFGLLSLVPPLEAQRPVPRDLIVLLDTSGSMGGAPLAQAVRLVSALVDSLGGEDQLELIEFSWKASRWQRKAVRATEANKADALRWLRSLRADGGTEMRGGIEAALASLREGAMRQVVLVTDGLIGSEVAILKRLSDELPKSCRFHSIGVGHGVNRALLTPAARAGRGVEIIVAPGEDVEPAMKRLLERTAQPQVVDLEIWGSALKAAPRRPLDLYAGSPALIPLELSPEGGTLRIRGVTARGTYSEELVVKAKEAGQGSERVLALYARERVEDLELEHAAVPELRRAHDQSIEHLGVDFQIATRLTSWVAVSDESTVDPTAKSRRVEQPHELGADLCAEGLGLRAMAPPALAGGAAPALASMRVRAAAPVSAGRAPTPPPGAPPAAGRPPQFVGAPPPPVRGAPSAPEAPKRKGGLLEKVREFFSPRDEEARTDLAVLSEEDGDGALQVPGRIRLSNSKRLAVAFEFPHEVDWVLPARVQLVLADGSVIEAEVEVPHTTATGRLEAGAQVRLVCKLEAQLPQRLTHIVISETASHPRCEINF